MNLIIVESGSKVKKIEAVLNTYPAFIGKSVKVLASVGHIYNLPGKKMSIDIENDFAPTFEIIPGKAKVITQLRQAIKKASHVFLAGDKDRAGEFISWSIKDHFRIPVSKYTRVTFNAITKPAITEGMDYAIQNSRKLNMSIVYAEQARRLLDRLIGYTVSPVVCKVLGGRLSAGRCQSPITRLIYERSAEINKFYESEAAYSYQLAGSFYSGSSTLKPDLIL